MGLANILGKFKVINQLNQLKNENLGIYLQFTVNYAMTDMKSDDQYNIVAGDLLF